MNLTSTNSLRLVERAQQGDSAAMDQLFDNYRALAIRYAYKLTRNRDEAEDLVSETFLKIHRSIGLYNGGSSFSTWMQRIMRNNYLDARKKRRVDVQFSLEGVAENPMGLNRIDPIDPAKSPLDQSIEAATTNEVHSVLGRLPHRDRQLLVLYHLEQFTYPQIAQVIKRPVGTVKSRVHRARLRLMELLHAEPALLESFGASLAMG